MKWLQATPQRCCSNAGDSIGPRTLVIHLVSGERLSMTVTRTATAKKFLAKELEKLAADERSIVERFINRGRVARNVAEEFEEHLSFGQRIADRFAATMCSWTFSIF